MKKQTPIFVVSSGRTGSTFLARLINRHPQLLCVSDLFEPVGEVPYFDRDRIVDGKEFFDIFSSPSFKQRIKYWREQPTAELLFLHEDDNMVSLLLSYTLAFLTGGKPLKLFYELREAMENFGKDSMANHLISFFDWLRDRFGKELWVERTGGSLPHLARIIETWPNAKIVHNYRDCRETVISMMTGSFFRLYLELTRNPQLDEWDSDYMPPIEEMGSMLNRWVLDAVAALEKFPDHQQMNLSYEDLMEDTAGTLLRFSGFVFDRSKPTPPDIAWAEKASTTIKKPQQRFRTLTPEDQVKLQNSCSEGLKALGYI